MGPSRIVQLYGPQGSGYEASVIYSCNEVLGLTVESVRARVRSALLVCTVPSCGAWVVVVCVTYRLSHPLVSPPQMWILSRTPQLPSDYSYDVVVSKINSLGLNTTALGYVGGRDCLVFFVLGRPLPLPRLPSPFTSRLHVLVRMPSPVCSPQALPHRPGPILCVLNSGPSCRCGTKCWAHCSRRRDFVVFLPSLAAC